MYLLKGENKMLKVIAKVLVKEEEVKNFLNVAGDLVEASRQEEANVSYELVKDLQHANTFYFIETWASKAALDIHAAKPHFIEAGEKFKTMLAGQMDLAVTQVLL